MMNPTRKFFATLCALVLALTAGACLVACGESERDQPIDKIALTENAADYTKYVNTYGRVFYNPDLGGVPFINSASGFEVCFRGTALRAQVQTVASGGSYANGMFSVFVDGETDSEAKILKTERSVGGISDEVTIADGLTDREHVVKVLKRTPSNRDRLIVSQISTDGELLPAPAKPSLNIEFYGDSITCGEGVLRPYKDENGNIKDSALYTQETQNVFSSYAGECAKDLGAAFRVFGRGGIALKYTDFTKERYTVANNYNSIAVDLAAAEYPYDYNSYRPDAVVIYLGTNDYFRSLKGVAKDDNGIAYSKGGMKIAVVNFVRDVIGRYYGKNIPVFICSNLMAPGSGLDEIMENAVTELKSDFPNAVAVKFDKGVTAGVGGHPVVEDSEIAGAKLAGEIRKVLGIGNERFMQSRSQRTGSGFLSALFANRCIISQNVLK